MSDLKQFANTVLQINWRNLDVDDVQEHVNTAYGQYNVSDFDIDELKKEGFTDSEVAEIMQCMFLHSIVF